jgi:formylglycine-generating enzyme required for sulfatase activity
MTVAAFRPAVGAEPVPGYRLEAFLGKGGFGEVWRAVGPGGFKVALKLLTTDEAGSERELRALELLKDIHDGHLLSIHGVWCIPGWSVLAMELANGTLMDRLKAFQKQGMPGIPREELLDHFQQAARGIDFLNEPRHVLTQGSAPTSIGHGDVKPQNLLLVGTACKVGDFGLLRRLSSTTSQKTNSLTAAYASPEAFEGRHAPQTDQYALAVSWCQLRSGRLPFQGGPVQLMAGHMTKPPDLSMLPATERAAVGRALSKKAEERWPNCRAFVEALSRTAPVAAPVPDWIEEVVPTTPSTLENTARGRPPLPPTLPPRPVDPTAALPRPARKPRNGPHVPRKQASGAAWKITLALAPVAVSVAIVAASIFFSGPNGSSAKKDDTQTSRDGGNAKDASRIVPPQKLEEFVSPLIGLKFVLIEPGSPGKPRTFLMGSPDGTTPPGTPAEEGESNDETPHRVTLTRRYYLATTLVTQQQWEKVMGGDANHGWFKAKDNDEKRTLPVDNVSWYDCVEFCNKLSEMDGKTSCYRISNIARSGDKITHATVEAIPDGTGYRLPTEAEWEYACRAGTTTPFWFGDSITDKDANYDATVVYGKNGKVGEYRKKPTPVTQFKANPWGLHDTHGNLYQWCEDCYAEYPKDDISDPVNLNKPEAFSRVLRGGSWFDYPLYCRAAYRKRIEPAHRYSYIGFRVALSSSGTLTDKDKKDEDGTPPQPPRKPRKFTNSVLMEMIPIRTGKFMMGSPVGEKGHFESEDLHEVRMETPYYLASRPVTVRQFRDFVNDKAYHRGKTYSTEPERDGKGGSGYDETTGKLEGRKPEYTWKNPGWKPFEDDHPVVNVTWNDAVAYCEWLKKKEGKDYRLPTEAEWEYACRAGNQAAYFTGDDVQSLKGYANVSDAAAKKKFPTWTTAAEFDDGYVFTSPVGSYKPNPWGLYDMHGNVWQWCSDLYGKYDKEDNLDPKGSKTGGLRVLRGGSWSLIPQECRAASRNWLEPAHRDCDIGFRVALSSPKTP